MSEIYNILLKIYTRVYIIYIYILYLYVLFIYKNKYQVHIYSNNIDILYYICQFLRAEKDFLARDTDT